MLLHEYTFVRSFERNILYLLIRSYYILLDIIILLYYYYIIIILLLSIIISINTYLFNIYLLPSYLLI
jgi:hypothetical protein